MAYGRPVVATAVGGLADVNGVLVPPGDVARLREVLEQLLADAGWRAHLGDSRARDCAGAARAGGGSEGARRRLRGGGLVKPSLLLHALRTAQPRQLRARALRPLRRRQLGAGTPPPFRPLDGPGSSSGARRRSSRSRSPEPARSACEASMPSTARRCSPRRAPATLRGARACWRLGSSAIRRAPGMPGTRTRSRPEPATGSPRSRSCLSWRRRPVRESLWRQLRRARRATSRTTCSATT